MRLSDRLDRFQRRHGWLGLPVGVTYKFIDDQGVYLAALITYYGLVSIFPLLLLALTVLGFVIANQPHLQNDLIGSALSEYPIVGKEIQTDVSGYHGSGLGLAVGIIGSIYGSLGVGQAGQNALNIVWAVPRNSRPNPLRARARSLAAASTLGIGVLATTGVSAVGSGAQPDGIHIGSGVQVLATVLAGLVNIALFTTAYRYLTVAAVTLRDVIIGAVVAAVAWQTLQTVGTYYIAHKLKGASEVYGTFAVVLGLVAWIFIEAVIIVFCAELNVVLRRRLWPRALMTPFTDKIDMTDADASAYGSYARAQRFKGFESISVRFEPPDLRSPPSVDPSGGPAPPTDRGAP